MTSILNDNSSKSSRGKKHALVVPLGAQAHVAAILRLAVQLAKRGVTITFLSLAQDSSSMKLDDELKGLDFNVVSYDPLLTRPKVVRNFKDVMGFIDSTGHHFEPIVEDLKAKQRAGLPGPTCIIYDRFCWWVRDAAKELNIPHYTFFSCGAILARFLQAVPKLFSDGTLAITEDATMAEFEGHVKIPGLPPLLSTDLPLTQREELSVSIRIGQVMESADAVIANTFYELEYPQIDEFRRQLAEHSAGRKIPKLHLIGPLSNASNFRDRSFVSGLDNRGADTLQWLDSRQLRSVLYICIGTVANWDAPQVYELALALEASEQSFLWVVRTGSTLTSLEEALPGFEKRTKGRGLIVSGWVPQLLILAHSSVGAFLTHCGWSSLIESVSSGVPMIGWPQLAEQQMNCRHVVDVLKIAVQLGHGTRIPVFIRHEEFEKMVRLVMVEEEGKAMYARAQELLLKAKASVAEGGPSLRALDEIADFIPSEVITV